MEPAKEDYDQVAMECSKGIKRAGLWAQAIAETGGLNDTTVSRYIQLRVTEIVQEREAALAAAARHSKMEAAARLKLIEEARVAAEEKERTLRVIEDQDRLRHEEALRRRNQRNARNNEPASERETPAITPEKKSLFRIFSALCGILAAIVLLLFAFGVRIP